jgi:hypothetical protein
VNSKAQVETLSMAVPMQTNGWLPWLRKLEYWGIVAYAVSLPLSMTASWILLTILLGLVAVDALLVNETRAQIKQALVLAPPVMALLAAVAISGLFNGGPLEALRSLWSLKGMAIYIVAALLFRRNEKLARNSVGVLLLVGAVAGIWGTIQQVFNFHPFGYRYLQGTGFLGGPMAFAGQMQMLALLAGCLLASGAYKVLPGLLCRKEIFALVTIANAAGLIFAGERSAWLGGILGTLAAAALFSFRSLMKVVVSLAVVAAVSWFTVPLVHVRVEQALSGNQDVSTRVRLQVWHTAIEQWQRSPVVGIGFLKVPHLDIPEAIIPGVSRDLNHAHSNYLQFLSTTGIIGLGAYLWLLIFTAVKGRRLFQLGRQRGEHQRKQAAGSSTPAEATSSATLAERVGSSMFAAGAGSAILAATVSLAVAGLFEYNFGTAQVRLMQWLLMGLLSLPLQQSQPAKGHDQQDEQADPQPT